ncbi:putative flagellin YvzB [mine drainage metagenome]|uniref:Putative flagellin YvzB n=1 Tax=mine drainage metagenome TaxID=410659 RepID=A0A1J5SF43_9ZZZZ
MTTVSSVGSSALQGLLVAEALFSQASSRIASGSALPSDNPANTAVAVAQQTSLSQYNAAMQNNSLASGSVSVGLGALQSANSTLVQMQSIASQAMSANAGTRATLASQYDALAQQVTGYVNAANFNGVNLVSSSSTSMAVNQYGGGTSTLTVNGSNNTASGLGLQQATGAWTSGSGGTAAIQASMNSLTSAMNQISQSVSQLGAAQSALSTGASALQAYSTSAQSALSQLTGTDIGQQLINMKKASTQYQMSAYALATENKTKAYSLRMLG